MKEGIFVGSLITQLFKHQDFSTELNCMEGGPWKAF
jgi:hypothetical protein